MKNNLNPWQLISTVRTNVVHKNLTSINKKRFENINASLFFRSNYSKNNLTKLLKKALPKNTPIIDEKVLELFIAFIFFSKAIIQNILTKMLKKHSLPTHHRRQSLTVSLLPELSEIRLPSLNRPTACSPRGKYSIPGGPFQLFPLES